MKKTGKAFRALGMIIRNPWLLNKVIDDNATWKRRVERVHGTGSLPVIYADDLFGNGSQTIDPFAFMEGGSLPTDLMLLKTLAGAIPSCKYFEIGTWRGESVANVASVAEKCVTLDLPPEEILGKEKGEEYAREQRLYSKGLRNVIHLEGHSATFDFSTVGKFDLVFIDGDHHYDSVVNDTTKVFRHLVKEDTIVVWHDYAVDPSRVRYEVMAAILDALPSSKHHNLYHFGNSLCAFYHPRDLSDIARPLSPSARLRFSLRIDF